jgi:hypothetical protein
MVLYSSLPNTRRVSIAVHVATDRRATDPGDAGGALVRQNTAQEGQDAFACTLFESAKGFRGCEPSLHAGVFHRETLFADPT